MTAKANTQQAAQALANLICPEIPLAWLPDRLRFFAQEIEGAAKYEAGRLSREQTGKKLERVVKASTILDKLLRDHDVQYALFKAIDGGEQLPGSMLRNLSKQAYRAIDFLAAQKGGAPSMQKECGVSLREKCALIIHEVWMIGRNAYPSAANQEAWEAARLLWQMAGQRPLSLDPTSDAWKRHIATIRTRAKRTDNTRPNFDADFKFCQDDIKSHLQPLGRFQSIEDAAMVYGIKT